MRFDLLGEPLELGRVDDAVIDETGQQFLDRATTELLEHVAHRVGRHPTRLLHGGVQEPGAGVLVLDELLRFQPPQHRADGRIGQRAILADRTTHRFAARRPCLPQKFQHLLFQRTQTSLASHNHHP